MATRSKVVEFGGLDIICNTIAVGATKPGQAGTVLSGSEIVVLDSVTPGTAAASKAVVADSDVTISGLGVKRAVIEDALAVTLTPAQSGGLVVFDKVNGAVITLPASSIGLWYDFVVDTASTSVGQKVITPASVFIKGTVNQIVTGADADYAADTANGSTHRSVNLNGTTTGGIVGSRFRLTCRSATVWEIEGDIIASGSVATTFATS